MLDRDYNLFVGTYSDLDVLAHQPYAPIPGKGIYAMTLDRKGKLTLDNTYEALNPAVLIPHSNGRSIYAILETIIDEGDIFRYEIDADGSLSYCDQFRASGRSTCYLATAPNQDAAIVINYWDAIIDVVDVDGDGAAAGSQNSWCPCAAAGSQRAPRRLEGGAHSHAVGQGDGHPFAQFAVPARAHPLESTKAEVDLDAAKAV